MIKINGHFRSPCLVGAVSNCADLQCPINSKIYHSRCPAVTGHPDGCGGTGERSGEPRGTDRDHPNESDSEWGGHSRALVDREGEATMKDVVYPILFT